MPRSFTNTTTVTLARLAVLAAVSLSLAACEGPPPKMVANATDDGVPANSASETRLAMEGKSKTTSAPAEEPSQLLTTPLATGAGAGAEGGATSAPATAAAAPASKGAGKGGPSKLPQPKEPKSTGTKVSKAECKQIFDRYIDLTIGSDTRFDGIPPEMIAQLKEQALSQAQSQKGDPCSTQEVSRAQFNCAIASPTTAAWQRCMK